ncbi:MAG: diguanylate cyclase [Candidatus Electrothrix sp. GW3-4]|uniref:diguanylate cyclase n=1 Tax=Candidatus Electrothrix sp. GW3-4 TaxID=3126740 RepID=UPI0030D0A186
MDTHSNHSTGQLKIIISTLAVVLLFWSAVLIGLLLWAIAKEKHQTLNYARMEARANFNKDIALRNWVARRGGVYVLISEETPPNPYLEQVPERDIETPSGRKLTLMNPAYMLRQTMQVFSQLYGVKGRITSLKALNPLNKPDTWEVKALRQFEQGVEHVSEISYIDGKPYLRYMQAFYTTEPCLKCHGRQGYVAGDVRGGVGVSISLEPYIRLQDHTVRVLMYSYAILWLIGLFGILLVGHIVMQQLTKRLQSEHALREQTSELERLNNIFAHQAMYDGLTQVHNRRAFDQQLREEWERWRREQVVFSLLMADIDFFKKYNDTYGHLAGDTCLRKIARALQKTAVRYNDFTARYGGEEFAILLPGTEIEQAIKVAEKARQTVEQLAMPHRASYCADIVTLSVGVAAVDQTELPICCDDLIRLADQALYEAKRTGRNRTVRFPP